MKNENVENFCTHVKYILESLQLNGGDYYAILNMFFDQAKEKLLCSGGNSDDLEVLNECRMTLLNSSYFNGISTNILVLKEEFAVDTDEIYSESQFISCCEKYLAEVSDNEPENILTPKKSINLKKTSSVSIDVNKQSVDKFKEAFFTIMASFKVSAEVKHIILETWLNKVVLSLLKQSIITTDQMNKVISISEDMDSEIYETSNRLKNYSELHAIYDSVNLEDPIFKLKPLIDVVYEIIPIDNTGYKYKCGDLVKSKKLIKDCNVLGYICGYVDREFVSDKIYILRPLKLIGAYECYCLREEDLEQVTV